MKVDWNNEKENLIHMIQNKESYESIGRYYGVSGTTIKKTAIKLGIELEPRRTINETETFQKGVIKIHRYCLNCGKELEGRKKSKNIFCDCTCQHEYEYKEYIRRWKNGEENGLNGEYGISNHIKHYLFEKHNCKCEKCGWGEINEFTGTIPLEVHHIDGDYTNNKEENLQVLCPNCHSLTKTYKNHNKVGRKDRKKYSN